MPELPEVETIRLSLVEKLTGRKITAVTVHYPRMVEPQSVEEFTQSVTGKTIQRLERRGKYLLLKLSENLVLALHLRMTGQLTVQPADQPVAAATYLILSMDNDTQLRFRDQRKFGKAIVFAADDIPAALAKMGPEPLEDEFTLDLLRKRFTGRKVAVKKALLNQEIIAGVGNIYADEALFVSGIHPARLVYSLTEPELKRLHQGIRQVLHEGIEHRGTTKRDYLDGEGNPGSYQNMLRVYGRKGEPCPQCGVPIAKMNFGGRGTHFCPQCQE